MKRRIFALLLCLALILAVLPATSYAATEISTITLKGFKNPEAGKSFENYLVMTTGDQGVAFYDVDWRDDTAGKFMEGNDTFQAGHTYSVQIWMEARDGYAFRCTSSGMPAVTATLDGNKLTVTKAYEYKAFAMVVLNYTFPPCEAPHTHTVSKWRITGAYHYSVCTDCGEMLEQEDHKGGKATCAQKGICAVCGEPYLDTTEDHVPDTSKWLIRGEAYHFHACKLCGAHCDIEDHRWSPKYHSVGAKGHAYQCADCKGYDTVHPHNPGPEATDTTPQTCKDCGYVIAPVKNHKHKLTFVPEAAPTCTEPGRVAYYTCDGCSMLFNDKQGKEPFEEGEEYTIPPLGHKISESWGTDANTHWRVCTVCNEVLAETKMTHEIHDSKCTTCGYDGIQIPEKTESVPETTNEANPGEKGNYRWVWILAIALAVLSVAAALVVVTVMIVVIVKKKRTIK